MRKFFALALAVAMVLSLASVSFAATAAPNMDSDIVLSTFMKYDGDKDEFDANKQLQYGKTYYAVIYEGKWTVTNVGDDDDTTNDTAAVAYAPITKYDQVEKLKVKAEFEMGEDLVESINIVKKNVTGMSAGTIKLTDAVDTTAAGAYDGTEWTITPGSDVTTLACPTGYAYCVELKTKAERVTGDADIVGTLEFNRKAKKEVMKVDDDEVDFALNLFYENNYNDDAGLKLDVEGTVELKWDDLYVLKYDNDDEVEFEFGKTDLNEGTFTVDVSGQGKMVIDFNTKANEAICDANPGAKMFFVNFNGAKFNRTGTFEYEMENLVAAYQIVDDKLVEINGIEIDGEVATFTTRTLGNYVFADAELVNAVVEAPVVEAPVVTNPSTGF